MLKGLTSTWKNGCNAKTLTLSEYIIIDNKKIPVKADLKDDCYNNGNFIGTFIFKEISFEVENNIDFKRKEFEYYKVVNGEAIKFGTFITTEITDNDTTELVKVVGMDFGLKTQVEYMSSLDYSSGLITLLDVWNECCELSGLTSGITDFTNSDFIVESDQFTGTGATIRDVFVAIAQSSCSFVKVMNDDKIYLIFNEYESNKKDGKAIIIDNSIYNTNLKLQLYGKSVQETRSGKNLLNVTAESFTTNGVTVTINPDKTIVLNGTYTGTNTFWRRLAKYFTIPAGTYTLSNGNPDASVLVPSAIFKDDNNNFDIVDVSTKTFTEEKVIKPYLRIAVGSSFNNFKIFPMIVPGDTVGEYEPYGASPSPDYPSEIENVKGKNLLPEVIDKTTQTKNGITLTFLEDNQINLKGTSTEITRFDLLLKESTKITKDIYAHFRNNATGNASIGFLNDSGQFGWYSFDKINVISKLSGVSSESSEINKIRFFINAGATIDITFQPSLEYTSDITRYVPYGNIQIVETGRNLLDNKNPNYIVGATWQPTDTGGIFSASTSWKWLGWNFKLNTDKQYTFSFGARNSKNLYLYIRTYTDNTYTTIKTKIVNDGTKLQNTFKPDSEYVRISFTNNAVIENIEIPNIQLEKGSTATDYEPYTEEVVNIDLKGNELTEYDKLIVKDGKAIIQKKSRNLSLAIADMNNSDAYPGWRNVDYIGEDYPDKNMSMRTFCNYKCNIKPFSEGGVYLNSLASSSILFLSKDVFGLTQTQWKEQYPDLVFNLVYELAEPYEIDLGEVSTLTTYEGTSNITNSEDAEMSVEYSIINEVIEDYTDLDDKRDTKPITCVRLGMSQIVGENLDLKDDELVKKYGEHWLIINDNPFAYTQKKREELIYAILDKIKGFGYSAFSAKTSFKPYLTCGDIIKFKNKNEELINSILLRYEHNYDEITLEAPSETSATVNYVYPANAIDLYKKAEAKVDKEANNITLLTEQTKTLRENLESDYYKKTNINELLQTAESGITNTFSEAGGNNIFRNTGLWFENDGEDKETNPYEFWKGKALRMSNDEASNGNSILLQNGTFEQEQEVPNGNYSISFMYKKLISQSVASVVINDREYQLDSVELKQFYTGEQDSKTNEYITEPIVVTSGHLKIQFKCNTNGGIEVYDLMSNKGSVKLAYSQNENETTTETVNISKGITITSTNMETIFKANANGIRILTLQNETIAYFTDKGLSTNELIVKNKAQVCGTLISEVGDQTWFTRM